MYYVDEVRLSVKCRKAGQYEGASAKCESIILAFMATSLSCGTRSEVPQRVHKRVVPQPLQAAAAAVGRVRLCCSFALTIWPRVLTRLLYA